MSPTVADSIRWCHYLVTLDVLVMNSSSLALSRTGRKGCFQPLVSGISSLGHNPDFMTIRGTHPLVPLLLQGATTPVCQSRGTVLDLRVMLKWYVSHNRSTTSRELSYPGMISSIPQSTDSLYDEQIRPWAPHLFFHHGLHGYLITGY